MHYISLRADGRDVKYQTEDGVAACMLHAILYLMGFNPRLTIYEPLTNDVRHLDNPPEVNQYLNTLIAKEEK